MKRRHVLIAPFVPGLVRPLQAAGQPWSARLLRGGFDGREWWSGVSITLVPDWKTYWRVPGDGGIAPQLQVSGENIASSRILYPLPHRFVSDAGTVIGYKTEVAFPIAITPVDFKMPVRMTFKSFFGVCEDVCIPAQLNADLVFDGTRADAPDQALIMQWQTAAPVVSRDGPIIKAVAMLQNEKPALQLDLQSPVKDIFIEGNPLHYFGRPSGTSGVVVVPVSGVTTVEELRGQQLRITVDAGSGALEQMVNVV